MTWKQLLALTACAATLSACQALPQSGQVDPSKVSRVQVGATKDQVRAVLGSPIDVQRFKRRNEEVWRYYQGGISREEVLVTFAPDGTVTGINTVPYVGSKNLLFGD